MLAEWWRIAKRILLVVGLLLTFFALLELLRAYQTLRATHPAVGYAFLALLVAGTAWLICGLVRAVLRHPPALVPPSSFDPEQSDEQSLRVYGRYLAEVMSRLAANPLLPATDRDELAGQAQSLPSELESAPGPRAAAELITTAADTQVEPRTSLLDREADRIVRECVGTVLLGVTLSPWRSADLVIVLQRNASMITRVIQVYNSRPRPREQLLVFRDVLAVVAIVQYLNFGTKLCERMFARLPVVGRFVDDIAQGVGAALMTSVAGHAAMHRCRSFRHWNQAEAEASIRAHLRQFSMDIRGVLFDDVLVQLRERVRAEARSLHVDPDQTLREVRDGLSTALDETDAEIENYLRPSPLGRGREIVWRGAGLVWRAARGTVAGARHTARFTVHAMDSGTRYAAAGARRAGRWAGNGGRRTWQGARRTASFVGRKLHRSDRPSKSDQTDDS